MASRRTYQVKEVAEIAGVSVRTLHHYDAIGLLVPGRRSDAGYRLYDDDDLLRLQQIASSGSRSRPSDARWMTRRSRGGRRCAPSGSSSSGAPRRRPR